MFELFYLTNLSVIDSITLSEFHDRDKASLLYWIKVIERGDERLTHIRLCVWY